MPQMIRKSLPKLTWDGPEEFWTSGFKTGDVFAAVEHKSFLHKSLSIKLAELSRWLLMLLPFLPLLALHSSLTHFVKRADLLHWPSNKMEGEDSWSGVTGKRRHFMMRLKATDKDLLILCSNSLERRAQTEWEKMKDISYSEQHSPPSGNLTAQWHTARHWIRNQGTAVDVLPSHGSPKNMPMILVNYNWFHQIGASLNESESMEMNTGWSPLSPKH